MKSWFSFALPIGIVIGFYIGTMLYALGRESVRRECPSMQHGERLLRSEQLADRTHCIYSSGWDSYGRNLKERKL